MRKLTAVLAFLSVLTVFAQGEGRPGKGRGNGQRPSVKGEIYGQVRDSISGEVLEFAAVSLYRNRNNELVTGAITNNSGKFTLSDVPGGKYYLTISFVGYQTRRINGLTIHPDQLVVNLKDIRISSNNQLDEIVLDGSRPVINYEIDKKVVDVSRLEVDLGQTAVEILENVPSVTVSNDGTVSLRGSSSFTLFIDGRPTALDANEALQIIPASSIKEIEIITNPSAKYESEGVSGIMNIITKTNKLEGVSMLINASAGNYDNYSGDVSVNWREEKYEVNLSLNYRNRTRPANTWNERISNFDSLTTTVRSEGEKDWQMGGYGVSGEFSWFPNGGHTFSIGGRYNIRNMNGFTYLYFQEFENDQNVLSYVNDEFSDRDFNAAAVFMTYRLNFQRDKNHYFEVRSTFNQRQGDDLVQADFLDADQIKQGGTRNTERGPSWKFRVNADYSKKYNNGTVFETGTQIQFGHSEEESRNYTYNAATGEYELQPLFSSDAIYIRNIAAVYALVKGKKNDFGYQLGLRAEYTDRDITARNFEDITQVNRLDWFPTVHLSYNLTKQSQVLLNYTRRIQRPRSYYLEPFLTWQNAYTVYRGNPNLLPEYIDAAEINWVTNFENRKGYFSLETYIRNVSNYISRIQVPYDTNQIMNTPVNVGRTFTLGLEPTFSYNLLKWWKVDVALNLYSFDIMSQHEQLESSHNFNWNSRLTNTFPLPKNWNIQVASRYISPTNTVQGQSKGYFTINGSVRKSFKNNKYAFNLQVRDIFNTIRREDQAIAGNVETWSLSIPKTPTIIFTFSMRLNNYNKRNGRKEGEADGDEF